MRHKMEDDSGHSIEVELPQSPLLPLPLPVLATTMATSSNDVATAAPGADGKPNDNTPPLPAEVASGIPSVYQELKHLMIASLLGGAKGCRHRCDM